MPEKTKNIYILKSMKSVWWVEGRRTMDEKELWKRWVLSLEWEREELMMTVVMKEMTNWHVFDQMRVISLSSSSAGRQSSLGSWFQRKGDTWRKERLLTFREEEEGGQERVTTSDEW